MSHTESCKACKKTFLKALRSEFGEVIEQWSPGWPCRIEDILDFSEIKSNAAGLMNRIYSALQNHRGYNSFVGRKTLPNCDYYIKSLNCLFEIDESQHFTAPRKLTLSLYPKNVPFSFDLKIWLSKCQMLNRHDNHPPNRDETRAWYDTLRDLLPPLFGMAPTFRIYAKDFKWCNVSREDTREIIKQLIKK